MGQNLFLSKHIFIGFKRFRLIVYWLFVYWLFIDYLFIDCLLIFCWILIVYWFENLNLSMLNYWDKFPEWHEIKAINLSSSHFPRLIERQTPLARVWNSCLHMLYYGKKVSRKWGKWWEIPSQQTIRGKRFNWKKQPKLPMRGGGGKGWFLCVTFCGKLVCH